MKPSYDGPLGYVLPALVALGLFMALFFPANNFKSRQNAAQRAQALNDVAQIAHAVNAFETEYGRLPGTNRGDVAGELLAALVGSNITLNPRGIVFLEVEPVTEKYHSGISHGTFIDCWGGPYQIAFADGTNHYVANVGAGTNATTIQKRVAVWSDPSLDPDIASLSDQKKSRCYAESWGMN